MKIQAGTLISMVSGQSWKLSAMFLVMLPGHPPGPNPMKWCLKRAKKNCGPQNIHWNACSREKVPPRKFNTLSTTRSQVYHSFVRSTRTILRRVPRAPARSQFYHSFARSTRTILRRGCSVNSKLSILPQFRAIDTHDLTKELHFRKLFPDHGASPLITKVKYYCIWSIHNTSKDRERNVRYIKGGLLRKGGYLAKCWWRP